jgi:hypothetical protein
MSDALDIQDMENPPDMTELARRQRALLRRVHTLEGKVRALTRERKASLVDVYEGRDQERPLYYNQKREECRIER